MNDYGNKLRNQLDKLENNIDIVHVKQSQIQRGEIFYQGGSNSRRLSTGILDNANGPKKRTSGLSTNSTFKNDNCTRTHIQKHVQFNIDEKEEEER